MTTMLFLIKQTRDFVDDSAGGQPFVLGRIPLTLSRVSSTFVDTSTQNFHILSRVMFSRVYSDHHHTKHQASLIYFPQRVRMSIDGRAVASHNRSTKLHTRHYPSTTVRFPGSRRGVGLPFVLWVIWQVSLRSLAWGGANRILRWACVGGKRSTKSTKGGDARPSFWRPHRRVCYAGPSADAPGITKLAVASAVEKELPRRSVSAETYKGK